MFILRKNEAQQERLSKVLKRVKVVYGAVPPQMEFLGNIDVEYLEIFLKSILKIVKHPHIKPDLFTFIRVHIAFKEDYTYCKAFNTQMLLAKGYSQEIIDKTIEEIKNIPFDKKHQALARYAIKAIYHSKMCNQKDFDSLYTMGWTQKDVFDVIEHAGTIFRNGRILGAYSKKTS